MSKEHVIQFFKFRPKHTFTIRDIVNFYGGRVSYMAISSVLWRFRRRGFIQIYKVGKGKGRGKGRSYSVYRLTDLGKEYLRIKGVLIT
jgi:DNA-binding PadR family transcriptional regulator